MILWCTDNQNKLKVHKEINFFPYTAKKSCVYFISSGASHEYHPCYVVKCNSCRYPKQREEFGFFYIFALMSCFSFFYPDPKAVFHEWFS